jgi:hypothetical protein
LTDLDPAGRIQTKARDAFSQIDQRNRHRFGPAKGSSPLELDKNLLCQGDLSEQAKMLGVV